MADDGSWMDENQKEENLVTRWTEKPFLVLKYRVKTTQPQTEKKAVNQEIAGKLNMTGLQISLIS